MLFWLQHLYFFSKIIKHINFLNNSNFKTFLPFDFQNKARHNKILKFNKNQLVQVQKQNLGRSYEECPKITVSLVVEYQFIKSNENEYI